MVEHPKYYHNSIYNLYIEKSHIPDAGFGVFTKDFIPAHSCIDEYSGDIYSFNPGGFYIYEYDSNHYIDARNYPRCYMSMINDCDFIAKKIIKKKRKKIDITPKAYYDEYNNILATNCIFKKDTENKKVYIFSLIDIKPNSELFLSYGVNYWN